METKKITTIHSYVPLSKRTKYAFIDIADIFICNNEDYEKQWKETKKQSIQKELKHRNVLIEDILEEVETFKKYLQGLNLQEVDSQGEKEI